MLQYGHNIRQSQQHFVFSSFLYHLNYSDCSAFYLLILCSIFISIQWDISCTEQIYKRTNHWRNTNFNSRSVFVSLSFSFANRSLCFFSYVLFIMYCYCVYYELLYGVNRNINYFLLLLLSLVYCCYCFLAVVSYNRVFVCMSAPADTSTCLRII